MPGLLAREDKPRPGIHLAHLAQNLKNASRQGHAVRETDLHPRAGNEPRGGVEIELAPLCLSRLAGADCREHHELEQEPQRHTRSQTTHGDEGFRHFAVRNRRVVPLLMLTRAPLRQHAVDGRTGRVVGAIALGDRPVQNRADALAHTSSVGRRVFQMGDNTSRT